MKNLFRLILILMMCLYSVEYYWAFKFSVVFFLGLILILLREIADKLRENNKKI